MPRLTDPSSRARGFFLVQVPALLVFLGGTLLPPGLLIDRARLNELYHDELVRIRAAGEPMRVEELRDWFHGGGPNPAPLYQKAFEARVSLLGTPDIWRSTPEPGEPMSQEMAEAKRDALDRNAEAVRLIREANAADGQVWFERDYGDGTLTRMPELGEGRQYASLLKAEVELAMLEGHSQAAAEALMQMFKLSEAYQNEPSLIGLLVRISLNMLTLVTVERAIGDSGFDDAQLRALQAAVREMREGTSPYRAYVGERVLVLSMDLNSRLQRNLGGARLPNLLSRASGLEVRQHVECLAFFQRLFVALRLPPRKRENVHAYLDALAEQRFVFDTAVATMAPMLGGSLRTTDIHHARAVAAEVGVAIARYHLQHERYPEKLEDLVPRYLEAVPEDPLSDPAAPLRLRVTPDGAAAVVYSVGIDGVDNGGRSRNERGRGFEDGTDVPFNLGPAQEILFPREPEPEPRPRLREGVVLY